MSCPACEQPGEGFTHSCEGSGTFRAAEAHVAGAVEEITAGWPRFEVTLHLRMVALDEDAARHALGDLVTPLLSDDLVEQADFSIVQTEAA